MNNVSRRSFLKLAGGTAAAVAGLGLVGCGGDSDTSSSSAKGNDVTGAEPQNGSPATTALDQLPLPEKGKAYNNPQDRDNIQDGGTLVVPVDEIGPDWNVYSVSGNTVDMQTFWGYYMPMNAVTTDVTLSKFEPNPDYITNLTSSEDSGKQVITVDINPQAKFNDGTPIDYRAYQAIWTVLNGKDENYTPAATDGYDKIESVERGTSDTQAVITMSEPVYPYEPLVANFLHPSAANVDTFNNGWNNTPHQEWGAGPFTIDSVSDSQVVFVPNPNWWGNKPKLDSITYKAMDSQATFNAFKNGEVDNTGASAAGSSEMLSQFNSMDNAEIRRAYSLSIGCIELNSTRDSLSDIAVRKAFTQCIDPATVRSVVFQGVNWSEDNPGSLLVPAWADGYEYNMPDDVKNLSSADDRTAAAKKTLEDAGYSMGDDGYYAKDGNSVKFSFTTFGDSNTVKNRAAAIQKMAKDAGMDVEIDAKPSSEFSKTLSSGEWDAALFAWSSSTTYMWNGVQIYGSDSASNFTHLGSADVDQKLAAVVSVSDPDQQKQQLNEAEKEAMETYGFIPLYTGPDCVVTKKGLANFGPCCFQTVLPENIGWQKDAQ
ncbi:MAG: ABC transporter family substrate-binding protein [Coriobacteriales bacterium]|nr:ABC transporter family substrate-binding protein [Coriobacteriales bacterium]